MSVKRRELIQYLEQSGFRLLREGGNHSIYAKEHMTVPVKRHKQLERITANEICKLARPGTPLLLHLFRHFSLGLTLRLDCSGRPHQL